MASSSPSAGISKSIMIVNLRQQLELLEQTPDDKSTVVKKSSVDDNTAKEDQTLRERLQQSASEFYFDALRRRLIPFRKSRNGTS